MMAISETSYKDQKEYWDYQRKIEYNKEQISNIVEKFEGRVYNDFGMVHTDDVKTILWDKIPPSEYEEPPKYWVPKDTKLKLWYEI